MSETRLPEYVVDLTNHSNRLRLESATPGRPMKVVMRDPADPSGPPIHGTGLLSSDQTEFTVDIPGPGGTHRFTQNWAELSARLASFSEFD
ncbi:MAG TPA: hypothetical protein VIO81_12240 [Methyloversatilis sp.]